MNRIETKIKNTKNFGRVCGNNLKKFKKFYKDLIKDAHRIREKNFLICLEKSDKFLRYRYEKLSNSIQKRLTFEGAYLKQILRVPKSWIIYYFACKYGIYFTRPHKKIFERINNEKRISKRVILNFTSDHLVIPAVIRPDREEICFSLSILAKKLLNHEIYVAVHFLGDNKILIEKIPFSPSKMRVDMGSRISIPIVTTPKEFLKNGRNNVELILSLSDYNLERKATILDNDARRLYARLKSVVEIPEYRLTYNLGQGDLDIKYRGKNIKIELSKMDFTKMRYSMWTKLVVGKIAITSLKYPDYIHLFIFHKKNEEKIKRLNDIINHFNPTILFSDFKDFNKLAKEIITRLNFLINNSFLIPMKYR